jgi:hypothetical protein
MALIHTATLTPSKLGLLTGWLPTRTWFTGDAEIWQVGAYRFDDPAGEVGVETLLVEGGNGSVFHVPLTYRGSPRLGGEEFLVGTAEHSVLGKRWVYDACSDPVWATALATTVLTGGTQVEEFVDADGRLERRAPTATVLGSGAPGTPVDPIDAVSCRDDGPTTIVQSKNYELVVVRVIGAEVRAEHTLTRSWAYGGPAVLAGVRRI